MSGPPPRGGGGGPPRPHLIPTPHGARLPPHMRPPFPRGMMHPRGPPRYPMNRPPPGVRPPLIPMSRQRIPPPYPHQANQDFTSDWEDPGGGGDASSNVKREPGVGSKADHGLDPAPVTKSSTNSTGAAKRGASSSASSSSSRGSRSGAAREASTCGANQAWWAGGKD